MTGMRADFGRNGRGDGKEGGDGEKGLVVFRGLSCKSDFSNSLPWVWVICRDRRLVRHPCRKAG